ncbi:MAG TPA: 2-C-methyl-D-erythritol 4-phosphate cytidylyltransferase [Gammaproteobacteria bacterium]
MADSQSPNYWIVIPAAGVGKRMGADRPKQYLSLLGKSVIEQTLDCFIEHPHVAGITVALSPDDGYWPDLAVSHSSLIVRAEGGAERCHSVLNALDSLQSKADENDWVLVHDAARPCLTRGDLDKLIAELSGDTVGGILAVPVRDTMKRGDGTGHIAHTEDRNDLWHALTPQMFRFGLLRSALQRSLADGFVVTDEASAIEHIGLKPRLVEGRADNIKVTRPEDLALAGYFLERNRGA